MEDFKDIDINELAKRIISMDNRIDGIEANCKHSFKLVHDDINLLGVTMHTHFDVNSRKIEKNTNDIARIFRENKNLKRGILVGIFIGIGVHFWKKHKKSEKIEENLSEENAENCEK